MSGLKRVSGNLKALAVVSVIVGAIGLLALDGYWQYVASIGAGDAVLGLSIGIVYGQAGMLVLSQVALSAVGAWTVAYLTGVKGWLPLPWSLFAGALVSIPIAIVVSLPALRLRRVNLAIVTVGFIVVIEAIGQAGKFPGSSPNLYVAYPTWFGGYRGLFLLCWLSFVILAAAVIILRRARWGLSWLAIARSERAAASMGVSVVKSKVTAFAVAGLIAGWGGGLVVATYGSADPTNFSLEISLTLFALAVMMGAGYWEGALALGFFNAFAAALLRQFNLSPDYGTLLFSLGAIQVLGAENGGFSGQIRRAIAKRRKHVDVRTESTLRTFADGHVHAAAAPTGTDLVPALEIDKLSVNYGAVKALQEVSFTVPANQIVGLVGPNGSGKSTLVDATTGFLASYSGSIRVGGESIDNLVAFKRAQVVRRTFQQDRTIAELTPEDYLRLSAAPDAPKSLIDDVLSFLGCDATVPLQNVDARMRRLLMIGACLVGQPKVILIDEPAAGLSMDESIDLAVRLVEIPERFNCGIVLIEHDMELVRLVCPQLVVLDFGQVIASGSTDEVLADARVTTAYLGDDVADEHALADEAEHVEPAATIKVGEVE